MELKLDGSNGNSKGGGMKIKIFVSNGGEYKDVDLINAPKDLNIEVQIIEEVESSESWYEDEDS